jgi:hypothetical protein
MSVGTIQLDGLISTHPKDSESNIAIFYTSNKIGQKYREQFLAIQTGCISEKTAQGFSTIVGASMVEIEAAENREEV